MLSLSCHRRPGSGPRYFETGGLLDHGDHGRVDALGREAVADPVALEERGLQQQPVRHRRGPVEQDLLLLRVDLAQVGLGRVRRRDAARAAAVHLVRPREAELVLLVRLPREPQVAGLAGEAGVALPAGIGLVSPDVRVVLVAVVEAPGNVVGRLLEAARHVEPDPVAPDRPAEPGVDVPVGPQLVGRGEARRAELLGEVVALHPLGGEVHVHRAAEDVAAVLRDHVDAHAALAHLRVHRGVVERDFLHGHHVDRGAGRVAGGGLGARRDAVEEDRLVALPAAVHGEAQRRVHLAAADVLRASCRWRTSP